MKPAMLIVFVGIIGAVGCDDNVVGPSALPDRVDRRRPLFVNRLEFQPPVDNSCVPSFFHPWCACGVSCESAPKPRR